MSADPTFPGRSEGELRFAAVQHKVGGFQAGFNSGAWRGGVQTSDNIRYIATRKGLILEYITYFTYGFYCVIGATAFKAKPAVRQGRKVADPERIRSRKAGLPRVTSVKVTSGRQRALQFLLLKP